MPGNDGSRSTMRRIGSTMGEDEAGSIVRENGARTSWRGIGQGALGTGEEALWRAQVGCGRP